MNRKKQIIKNLIVLMVLIVIFVKATGMYFTPLAAHKSSERSIHYGPSEVIHVEDLKAKKYYLCKYDRWVSCNTVNRSLYFFWSFGNQPTGFENKGENAIEFSGGVSKGNSKLYGIINDENVYRIWIERSNGEILEQSKSDFYDNLFLFYWKDDKAEWIKEIKAFDEEGALLFEDLF